MTTIAPSTPLYRAVWRWHFYAGLIVLPFLAWLAITGALYLYKPEIERVVYREWIQIEPRAVLPLATVAARIGAATGGRVTQIARPASPTESWRLTIALPDGAKRTAFVDPHDARVLGTTAQGGVMQIVRTLHGLAITGPVGNALIEIAAGWAIVLVVTGLYLWWPRGTPAIGIRARPAKRLFWRDLHASTGVVAAAIILFLAVTGMPWSVVSGRLLQSWVTRQGIGRPAAPGPAPWEATKTGHAGHDAAATLPWSLQHAAVPTGGADGIGPDRAVAAAHMPPPWTLTVPARADAPYLVSAQTIRAQDARAVYVDAASGAVLQDARYAAFGIGARTIEWGIATHQGQQYGEPNRLIMLFGCLCILLLAISAPVMWWKRRPRGRIGAPPGRDDPGLIVLMIGLALLLPLTLATMIAALLLERWTIRRR